MKCQVCQFEDPNIEDMNQLFFIIVCRQCVQPDGTLKSNDEMSAWALRLLEKLDRVKLIHANGKEVLAEIVPYGA